MNLVRDGQESGNGSLPSNGEFCACAAYFQYQYQFECKFAFLFVFCSSLATFPLALSGTKTNNGWDSISPPRFHISKCSATDISFAGSPWGQLGLCFWLSVISMSFAALMSHCTCTYVHVYLNMCAWLCRRTADLHSVYVQTKLFSGLSLQIFVTLHSSYKVAYFVCIIFNYFPYGVYIFIYILIK